MKLIVGLLASAAFAAAPAFEQNLKLNDKGYFAEPGLNVVCSDYYPEGHQTGVHPCATNFMFLALAADRLYDQKPAGQEGK